jgi:hypothetical protein
MRVFYRYLAGSIFLFTAAILLSANFLLVPGERNFPLWLKSGVEMLLCSSNCKLDIGSIKLIISEGDDKDYLILEGINLNSNSDCASKTQLGNIKEVVAKFKLRELFRHLDLHIDLDFKPAIFNLAEGTEQASEQEEDCSDHNEQIPQIFMENVISAIRVSVLHFGRITCNNWQFYFPVANKKQKFKINKAYLNFDHQKTNINGYVSYGLNKIKHQMDINIKFKQNKILESDFKFREFPAHIFINQSKLPGTAQMQNSSNRLHISGELKHVYNTEAITHNFKLNLDKINGTLVDNNDKNKQYPISNSDLSLTISRDFVKLTSLNLKLGNNSHLKLSGAFSFKDYHKMLYLDFNSNNLPVDFKNLILPPDINIPHENFTLSAIYGGKIDKAEGKIYLAPNYFNEGSLNENIFEGSLNISNAGINYYSTLPDLKNFTAKVNLGDNKAEIISQSGKAASSSIVDLKYVIPLDYNSSMSLDANVLGPASDVTNYIDDETLAELKNTKIDLSRLSGELDADIKLEIPYSSEPIKYDVSAKASGVSLSILDDYIRIDNGEISGKFDGNKLTLTGPMDVEGHNAQINHTIENIMEGEAQNDLQVDVHLTPEHKTGRLIEIMEGDTNLHFTLLSNGAKGNYKVFSDLTNVAFRVTKGGVYKHKGEKGVLNLYSEFKNSESELKYSLKGDEELDIKGVGKINDNYTQFDLDTIKFGAADCKLHYMLDQERSLTKISGKSLDLSQADFGKLLEKESDKSGSALNLQVDKATLKNNVVLKDVYLNTMCSNIQCYEGKMSGTLEDDSIVQMNLYNIGDEEKWILHSNNAGKVLSGFGINDNVQNGNLMASVNVSRKYSRDDQISVVSGNLHLNKFSTTKMPFMTRILSFLSFPGIMSAISTNEIPFKSFDINFKYDNHKFTLSDGEARGKYFDFTMEGGIDTEKQKLNIGGKVVISMYGISTILKNLPLISNIFSKKDKVGGLFVAPYSFEQEY